MDIIFDVQGLCLHSLNRGTDNQGLPGADGKTVNRAEYGFNIWIALYLQPALAKTAPLNIIAVWDGGNDLRRGWYPNYKGNRPPKEERCQVTVAEEQKLFGYVKQFMAALGCMQISCPMTEADDVIALLVEKLPGPNEVYTMDADLGALASAGTTVYLKNSLVEGDIKGIPTSLITLNKSIVGDSSDNYNGVSGFGPKTWEWMLEEYGADGMLELQQLIATDDHDALKEVATENGDKALLKLAEDDNWNRWRLMWQLASFHPEACYRTQKRKVIRPQFFKRVPSIHRLATVLKATGCERFSEGFNQYMPSDTLVTAENLEAVTAHIKEWLPATPVVGFDYETYDTLEHPAFQQAKPATVKHYVDVLSQSVTGASFNYGDNLQFTVYISVDHADTDNCPKSAIAEILCEVWSDKLCCHNAAFEAVVSEVDEGIGVLLDSPADTQIMAAYVEEDDRKGLKFLSKKHLNYEQASYQETLDLSNATNMQQLTGNQVLSYGCDDATVTGHLFHLFRLSTLMEGTFGDMAEYEFPAIHPLNHGFIEGVRVDLERLKELEIEDAKVIEDGMALIRSELAAHCTEIHDKGALAYWKDQYQFLRAKMLSEGKDEATVKDTLEGYRTRLLGMSQYQEYRSERKKVEFIPTKIQFQKVCNLLGITFEIPEEIQEEMQQGVRTELPSDVYDLSFPNPSASGITAWLAEVEAWLMETTSNRERITDIRTFLDLLPPAIPEIRQRSGVHYSNMLEFCEAILAEDAPEIWLGDELNFDSPPQNAGLLYCKLALPIRVRTKVTRGSTRYKLGFEPAPATDDKALETAIAEDCQGENEWKRPVLQAIRDVKAAKTRGKLYYHPYPLWIHPRDGMIHPQIINCGTATHRPTGSAPNFLQITKKDGGKIRSCVLPREEEHIIISPDFSGQELRILASECEDPVLMDAYLGEVEKDVHSITAAAIAPNAIDRQLPEARELIHMDGAGVDYDDFCTVLKADFTSEIWLDEHGSEHTALYQQLQALLKSSRKEAKTVNFLINYLGGANTLSRNLGIPREKAQLFMDMTFKRYARIQPWQQSIMRFASLHGYTETAYGTRRHMTDDILSSDGFVRSRAERQAVNFVIQGAAARILKIVLTEVWRSRLLQETGAVIIAPVYDELTASVPISNAVEYIQRLSEIMTVTPPGHPIPMKPEVDLGPNWGSLRELGAYPSVERIEAELDRIRFDVRAAA